MRVIVADDSLLFREGTARILGDAGMTIVAQAGTAAELVAHVRHDPPDVAIIDIRMPPTHTTEGIDAATEIRKATPNVGLCLLSQHVETHYAMRLIREFTRGVGYLLKDRVSDLDVFVRDIRRVADGECVIDADLVARLVDKKRRGDPLRRLTDREREVLALMARGHSNHSLATELVVSAKTIETHVRNIFIKLDLPDDVVGNRRVLAVLTYLRS